MKLFFCQNDPLMGEPFWQNNSLVSHILFELQPIIIFSPVANFGNQSLPREDLGENSVIGTFSNSNWDQFNFYLVKMYCTNLFHKSSFGYIPCCHHKIPSLHLVLPGSR